MQCEITLIRINGVTFDGNHIAPNFQMLLSLLQGEILEIFFSLMIRDLLGMIPSPFTYTLAKNLLAIYIHNKGIIISNP